MHIIIIVAIVGFAFFTVVTWHLAKLLARDAVGRPDGNFGRGRAQFFLLLTFFSLGAAGAIDWWASIPIFVIGLVAYQSVVGEKEKLARVIKGEEKKLEQAIEIIKPHSKELAIKRKQLVVKGSYGLVDTKKWEAEKGLFLTQVIEPVVGVFDVFSSGYARVLAEIESAATRENVEIGFSNDMSPIEYEHFVADVLKQRGWEARLTKASGDQGVDVVAEKSGKRVAIQCKLYSQPVGNAAVQEIIAGRAFEKTQFAAVVTNNTYTPAAKQLATSAGVLLLHHDQLPDLEFKLLEG